MVLPWKNYLETNEVSFQLTDEIKYIAYPEGHLYGVLKQENGKEDILLDSKQWEDEKHWISDNYSDIYGLYEPCALNQLEPDDDKVCIYGKAPDGAYLDRLQRYEHTMNHYMTSDIIRVAGWGMLHTPDRGKTLWKTEWSESIGDFYNCMRCDVFPENPGWKTISREDAYSKIREVSDEADTIIQKLNSLEWNLPFHTSETIIGNYIIN